MNKKIYDKDEVKFMMRKLGRNTPFRKGLDECVSGVVSVMKGGEEFAKYLCDRYKKPFYEITTHLYNDGSDASDDKEAIGKMKKFIDLKIPLEFLGRFNEKFMFVDDVYETGTTWEFIHRLFPNSKLVVLVAKNTNLPEGVFAGDYWAKDDWVEFEWK